MTYEEFQLIPESVKAAMLWAKHEQERSEETDVRKLCVTVGELMEFPKPPMWFKKESERDYRRGFHHGVSYGGDLVERLARKGFTRPQEIANIINDFEYSVLYPWRLKAGHDVASGEPIKTCGHPYLEQESWSDIKKRILQRDHRQCCSCGSDERLCIDHIHPVCHGGLPKDDNLQTLCTPCNGRKSGNIE